VAHDGKGAQHCHAYHVQCHRRIARIIILQVVLATLKFLQSSLPINQLVIFVETHRQMVGDIRSSHSENCWVVFGAGHAITCEFVDIQPEGEENC
jgi:hypothetical protein